MFNSNKNCIMIFIFILYLADVFAIQFPYTDFSARKYLDRATLDNNRKREPAQSRQNSPLRGIADDILLEFKTTINVHLSAKHRGHGRAQSSSTSIPKGYHVNYTSPDYSYEELHDDTPSNRGSEYPGLPRAATVTVQTKKTQHKGLSRNIHVRMTTRHKKGKNQNVTFPVVQASSSATPGWTTQQFSDRSARKPQKFYLNIQLHTTIFPEYSDLSRDNPVKTNIKKGKKKDTTVSAFQARSPASRVLRPQYSNRPAASEVISDEFKYPGISRVDPIKSSGRKNYIAFPVSPVIPGWQMEFPDRSTRMNQISSVHPKYSGLSRDIVNSVTQKRTVHKGHKKNIPFSVPSAIPGWRFPGLSSKTDQKSTVQLEYSGYLQDFPVKSTDTKGKKKDIAFSVSPAIHGWQMQFPGRPPRMNEILSEPKYGYSRDIPVTVQPKRTDFNQNKKNITFSVAPAIPGWRLQYLGHRPRMNERFSDTEYSGILQDIPVTVKPKRTDYKENKKSVTVSVAPAIPSWRLQYLGHRPRMNERFSYTEYSGILQDIPVTVQPKRTEYNEKNDQAPAIPGWRLQFSSYPSRIYEKPSDLEHSGVSQDFPLTVLTPKSTEYNGNKNNITFLVAPAIPGWQLQYHDPTLTMSKQFPYVHEYPSILRDISVKATDKEGKKNIAFEEFQARPPAIPGERKQLPDQPDRTNGRSSGIPKNPGLSRDVPFIVKGTDPKQDKRDIALPAIPGWQLQYPDPNHRMNEKSAEPEHSGLRHANPFDVQPKTSNKKYDQKDIGPVIPGWRLQYPDRSTLMRFSTYEPQYTRISREEIEQKEFKNGFPVSSAILGWPLQFPSRPPLTNKKHFDKPEYAGHSQDPVLVQSTASNNKKDAVIVAFSVAPGILGGRQKSEQPLRIDERFWTEPNYKSFSQDIPVTVQGTDQKGDNKYISFPIFQSEPPAIATWEPHYPIIPVKTNERSSDEFPILKEFLNKYPEGTMEPKITQYTHDMNFAKSNDGKQQKLNVDVEVKVKMSV